MYLSISVNVLISLLTLPLQLAAPQHYASPASASQSAFLLATLPRSSATGCLITIAFTLSNGTSA